jgi:molybdopterin biosynthesis enzyme
VRVQLETRDGVLRATPTGDQSSAILLSMVRADGLALVSEDETHLPAGSEVSVQLLSRDDLCEESGP